MARPKCGYTRATVMHAGPKSLAKPSAVRRTAQFSLISAALLLSAVSGCRFLQGEPAQSRPEPEPAASASVLPLEMPAAAASEGPPPSEPQPENVMLPGVQPSGGPTRGTLPKAAVTAGVAQGNDAFEACYLKASRPGQRGTIVVNFVVTPEGNVPHASALEQGTDFPDDQVIDCVLSAFKKLHFQPPSGGRAVVTYPLKFEPTP